MQHQLLGSKQGAIDYQWAFYNAPVGQAIGRYRMVVDCNALFAEIFQLDRIALIGQSFESLYPTQVDFEKTGERITPMLTQHGYFSEHRVMRRGNDELFWVHVSGFTLNRSDPFQETLWAFTDLSREHSVESTLHGSMTPRERDIAALLIERKTGKEIGKALGISPRTVDVYKTRLLRKYGVTSTAELVKQLL
jgi:DNA-binding CsgD family transcriptional regulator